MKTLRLLARLRRPPSPAAGLPCARRFGVHRATLRSLCAGDETKLLEFFTSHTPETIRARYGYIFRHLSHERARELVNVAPEQGVALGLFEGRGTTERLVAIGRYFISSDGKSAEAAFVVREDRRNLGIATALLRMLQRIARASGIPRLTAQVQRDNVAMLAIFRGAGATVTNIAGTGAVEVALDTGLRRTESR